ncbi:MAG: hypothetical protein IPO26_04540 [Saprospiraceae bacterium]|nr:hypothetical protein [Saprospiraceae bacterium]
MPNTPDTQKKKYLPSKIFLVSRQVGWSIGALQLPSFFLGVCLGIAAFVKYPDKLVMPAKLFTENPPVEIVCKLNAEIDSIDKRQITCKTW